MKQVDKKHYLFDHYSHAGRWVSYYHQLDEVLRVDPETILEIGVGDKVFSSYIKNNTAVKYVSLDVAEDLQPDVVGDLTTLPFPDNSFDVVCAFEVLEHIPFDQFTHCLREMSRVSARYIIISVPHFGPSVEFAFKIPFLKRYKWSFKIPFNPPHVFNGEHHWEIGKKNYPIALIRKKLAEVGIIERDFVPFENQYHHFFVLKKK